ncbi:hypothetical protein Bpfe_020945, partial [Biomphalaria pfeifferi]
FVLNVESCLDERECVRLSEFQSIDYDQMPGYCKNLTKAKSCFDKVLRECKSVEYHKMISIARNSTDIQYNTYCFFNISHAVRSIVSHVKLCLELFERGPSCAHESYLILFELWEDVARTAVQRPLCQQHYVQANVENEVFVLTESSAS